MSADATVRLTRKDSSLTATDIEKILKDECKDGEEFGYVRGRLGHVTSISAKLDSDGKSVDVVFRIKIDDGAAGPHLNGNVTTEMRRKLRGNPQLAVQKATSTAKAKAKPTPKAKAKSFRWGLMPPSKKRTARASASGKPQTNIIMLLGTSNVGKSTVTSARRGGGGGGARGQGQTHTRPRHDLVGRRRIVGVWL